MKVQLKRTDSIIPYDNNPRQNDGAVSAVATSIREFGFRQPIVVDEEDVVIVGHTRLKAAQHLGLDKVPVHVATDLTDAQKKAYRIADNQTAAIAEWDVDLLPVELQELEDLDFDMALLGFSDTDLARYMNSGGTVGATDPELDWRAQGSKWQRLMDHQSVADASGLDSSRVVILALCTISSAAGCSSCTPETPVERAVQITTAPARNTQTSRGAIHIISLP